MRALSDEMGENIAERTLVAKERYEVERERYEERRDEFERRLAELRERRDALLHERRFGHSRLLEAFPNMQSIQHAEAVEHLREAFRARRKGGAE